MSSSKEDLSSHTHSEESSNEHSQSEESPRSSSYSSQSSLDQEEMYLAELAQAVEDKVKELGVEIHPELGPLVLRYADALLTKEENNLDPMANEEQHDLEVAWECFEQARLCVQDKDQLGFIHQRLGDLTALQGNFIVAVTEYEAAKEIMTEGRKRAGVLVPLGNALLMLQRPQEAKDAFSEALGILKEDAEIAKAIQESIAECEEAIQVAARIAGPTALSGSEIVGPALKFDAPTLPNAKVVQVAVRRKAQGADSPVHKKSKGEELKETLNNSSRN